MTGIRFEWGAAGARHVAPHVSCLVVVDVLSFTTAVSVAVDAGTRVFPYRWRDASAEEYAARVGAALAVGRREVGAGTPWSLSPAALRRAPFTPRLVLPSPNGSAIAAEAAGLGVTVVAASLRNARAVAQWLTTQEYGTPDRPLAVVAAGEQWPDGSLRPALEDQLGAGAVISMRRDLGDLGATHPSPEAAAAAAVWDTTADPATVLHRCHSGRELTQGAHGGFAEDVDIAAELNGSKAVPVLTDGAFTAAP
ncbi:2-phosphosulfolactate phosphatase [Streptomyces sp. NPDC007861]|uniref:2-phosphosulfolactate phosphatase n=1 Tax=Streptomyces sp. NPDC007861 TaxID=3154893 RepID=UPI0033FD8CF5